MSTDTDAEQDVELHYFIKDDFTGYTVDTSIPEAHISFVSRMTIFVYLQ